LRGSSRWPSPQSPSPRLVARCLVGGLLRLSDPLHFRALPGVCQPLRFGCSLLCGGGSLGLGQLRGGDLSGLGRLLRGEALPVEARLCLGLPCSLGPWLRQASSSASRRA
jgi:hypothetical protein